MLYSQSTGGFYDSLINTDIPTDAVEIGSEEHAKLLLGQSQGKRIVPNPDGFPELAEPLPVDPQIAANAKLEVVRGKREVILNRLAGIVFAAKEEGDTDTVTAYLAVRVGLLDITKDLPSEGIDAEIQLRYNALADQCTEKMRSAFKE